MSADMDNGGERTQTVEQKLGTLSASVAERFDAVDAALIEQRQFTESAFDAVDAALIEQRQYTEFTFDRLGSEMRVGFNGVDSRFNRLERKLDQFIDTQSKANELVERRLRALEPRSGQE